MKVTGEFLVKFGGVVPVCFAFLALVCFALPLAFPAPVHDDYDSILNFLIDFSNPQTSKLGEIFRYHNEHRTLVNRLLTLLSFEIYGGVNLFFLSVVSLIIYGLWIGLVTWSQSRGLSVPRYRQYLLVPWALMVCQPLSYEAYIWQTIAISNGAVFLFATMAFVLLAQSSIPRVYAALVAFGCALVTMGNGVVVFPVALVLLISACRWREAVVWAVGGGALIALSFWGYVPPAGHPSAYDSLTNLPRTIAYILTFIGSAASFGDQITAIIWGAVCSAWLLFLVLSRYARTDSVMMGVFLFAVGSIAVNSLVRSGFGSAYPLTQNRYQWLSSVVLAFWAFTVLDVVCAKFASRKRLVAGMYGAVVSCSALFCLNCYSVTAPKLVAEHRELKNGLKSWARYGHGLRYPWADRANTIMNESVARGIFILPPRLHRAHHKRMAQGQHSL